MQRPPDGVKMVIEATCIMKGIKPKKVPGEKVGGFIFSIIKILFVGFKTKSPFLERGGGPDTQLLTTKCSFYKK